MTGTLVEWVEAIGTWASAVLAIPAIWLAFQADRLAKVSNTTLENRYLTPRTIATVP